MKNKTTSTQLCRLQILFYSLLISIFSNAQGPGGYSTNLNVWFKSNDGTGVTADGDPLSKWLEFSGNSNHSLTQTGSRIPIYYDNSSDNMNYNPVVNFDGTNDHLVLPATAGPLNNDNYSVFLVANPDVVGGTAAAVYTVNSNIANQATRFRIRASGPFLDQWESNGVSTTQSVSAGQSFLFSSQYDNTAGRQLYLNGGPETFNASTAHNGVALFDTHLGCQEGPGGRTFFFDGNIVEVIHYTEVISAANRDRVHSYLSLKYGITIDNSGGGTQGDYTATNGTTLWDASANSAYHNDVIGIGRDDNQSLTQRQSHNSTDNCRIYLDALASTNNANTGSFTNDISYVFIGNNQGDLCSSVTSVLEMPTGLGNCDLYSRLEREWRITKTNLAQTFHLDLILDPCAIPGSLSTSELRLLVDDDGDFSNGGTSCYYNGDGTGIVISYSNPIITISNIDAAHIPNNDSRYITIASTDATTPLPVELISFEAKPKACTPILNWSTASESHSDYFILESSEDAKKWTEVTRIDAAEHSSTEKRYSHHEKENFSAIRYYRLILVNMDGSKEIVGQTTYTPGICDNEEMHIHPNPLSNDLYIRASTSCEIHILDNLGRKINKYNIIKGENHLDVSDLQSGIYYVQYSKPTGESSIHRIIKR